MATLNQLIARYQQRLTDVPVHAVEDLASRIVYRTPVDTGLLRRSWTPDVNRLNNSNSGGSITAAARRARPGDSITFVNAQPYARPIEYTSHSPQAPRGMLNISCAEWPQIVAEAARRARGGI